MIQCHLYYKIGIGVAIQEKQKRKSTADISTDTIINVQPIQIVVD
jgi:hypothetical protein